MEFPSVNAESHAGHSSCFVKEGDKYYCYAKSEVSLEHMEAYKAYLEAQKVAEQARDSSKIVSDLNAKISAVESPISALKA